MILSVFDLFSIGIGPSSSHTVGPMRAANDFVERLERAGLMHEVATVTTELFGSLAATGVGHGTVRAVVLGLLGYAPESVRPESAYLEAENVTREGVLMLGGVRAIQFAATDVILRLGERLPFHSNGIRFEARSGDDRLLLRGDYFSVGGGFVVKAEEAAALSSKHIGVTDSEEDESQRPFSTGADLVAAARTEGVRISDLIFANETSMRSETEVRSGVLAIWGVMKECIEAGCAARGELPGGLRVQRRAAELRSLLESDGDAGDPLRAMEWVTVAALAVNEQNAAGERVVTAPTNGAAGIIPAVIDYYLRFVPGADDDGVVRFLLTATGIGTLFKMNASISGAEVGCQGEVGSACSMAAAGLAEVLGGSPEQVEYAAEIGLEHNLGLTCDPVGGLVQIPCIERNAIGAVKAITAARMAVRSNGQHLVSLDAAIATMKRTGFDMHSKYKETALGGLALTLAAVEC